MEPSKVIPGQVVFSTLIGSNAYGTNTPESDLDYKGIFIQSIDDLVGFNYIQQFEQGKDACYYEIRRFIELAQSANPTILEMLFVPDRFIITKNECLKPLFDNKHKFITKKCFHSFGGYAVAQIKKAKGLNKKMNWEQEKVIRKTPLDFCYIQNSNGSIPLVSHLKINKLKQEFCGLCAIDHMPNCYLLYYDYVAQYSSETNTKEKYPILGYKGIVFEDSNDIRLSSIPKGVDPIGIIYYNKDAYSIHCKEYNQYQEWLSNRNTQRYVDIEGHQQKIDGKNLMHCIRLLNCAIEIGETGQFQVYRPEREYLLSIRQGKVNLEDIIKEAEEKLKYLNELESKSKLPHTPDVDMQKLILEIRTLNTTL